MGDVIIEEKINIEREVKKPKKKRNVNTWGIYISICFVIVGLIWYGVNIGIIPLNILQEQAGPIILVIIGLLILIKSF